MKRFAALLAAVLVASSVTVAPVRADASSTFEVSSATVRTTVVGGSTTRAQVSAKLTSPGTIKLTIFRGDTAVRTVKPGGRYSSKTVSWNLLDADGDEVQPGVYRYRVTATRSGVTSSRSGRFRVFKRRTTTETTTTPVSDPATVAPSEPVSEPVVAPVVVPVAAPAASTSRWVGFYVPGVPASMGALDTLESKIGTDAAVVNFFIADTESFPTARCQNVVDHGAKPLVTLEFWSTQNGGLDAINNGSKDAYLRTFADSAKAFGQEVWLRPFHEMNGNWYPWSGTASGNSSAELIAAWRHVNDIFKARGATNVKFVWCVNNDSVPNTSANQIEKYWPGDAYVDRVALDGYNWGTSASWSSWRSFGAVFGPSYDKVTGLTTKPLFIAETGCSEQGGSKAAWITDMFKSIHSTYTRVRGVTWFEANKECDWRVSATSTSVTAFKAGVTAGY